VDEVNFGVSPGDDFHPGPYAYVGPWRVPPLDGYWNAPFGALREPDDIGTRVALLAFYREAAERVRNAES
jgi:hypothetical protein